jgi:hypothetical protein
MDVTNSRCQAWGTVNGFWEFPEKFIYVKDGQYYQNDDLNFTPLPACPEKEWVYHKGGWKDTGRTKKWRWKDGRTASYN